MMLRPPSEIYALEQNLARLVRQKKDCINAALDPDFILTDKFLLGIELCTPETFLKEIDKYCIKQNSLEKYRQRLEEVRQFISPAHMKEPNRYYKTLGTLLNITDNQLISKPRLRVTFSDLRDLNEEGPRFELPETYERDNWRKPIIFCLGKDIQTKDAIQDLQRIGTWYRENQVTLGLLKLAKYGYENMRDQIIHSSHTTNTQK